MSTILNYNLRKDMSPKTRVGYQSTNTKINEYKPGMAKVQELVDSGVFQQFEKDGVTRKVYKLFFTVTPVDDSAVATPAELDTIEDADGNIINLNKAQADPS